MDKDRAFLELCEFGSKLFSTCSKRKYMAIIVDQHGIVEATGYNGVPSGMKHCDEGGCPRAKNGVPSGTPYDYGDGLCYALHAEANCLMHSDVNRRRGGTLYVNGMPCFGCAKLIANSGLDRLVYVEEDRLDSPQVKELLEKAGVSFYAE